MPANPARGILAATEEKPPLHPRPPLPAAREVEASVPTMPSPESPAAPPGKPAAPAPARRRLYWALGLAGLLLALGLAYVFRRPLEGLCLASWAMLKDRETFRQAILSFGPWGPLVFIAFQVAQVFIAPIPGELTGVAGGYIFGWLPALIYSTVGLTLGSVINFAVARLLGRAFVERAIPAKYLDRVAYLMERQGVIASFIFFVVPGFPKDYLCYVLGLSPMGWRVFLLACALGRLPGTLMLSLQGSLVYQEDYWSFLWVGLASLAFIAPVYIWREPIYRWLYSFEKGRGPLEIPGEEPEAGPGPRP